MISQAYDNNVVSQSNRQQNTWGCVDKYKDTAKIVQKTFILAVSTLTLCVCACFKMNKNMNIKAPMRRIVYITTFKLCWLTIGVFLLFLYTGIVLLRVAGVRILLNPTYCTRALKLRYIFLFLPLGVCGKSQK